MVDISDKNIIYGLAFQCPYINRLVECPLYSIDNLNFREKIRWIEGIKSQMEEEILNKHRECKNKHNGYEKW